MSKSKAKKQVQQQQEKFLKAAREQKKREAELKRDLEQLPGRCRGCGDPT